jgi:hypothetical protein
MAVQTTLDLRGRDEVDQLLDQLHGRELNNRTRRALRAGAGEFRDEMRRQGRKPGYPRGFSKTRTRSHRNPLGVSVSPKSPLSTIFEHGAGVHTIAPRARGILAGPSGQRSRDQVFFARGPVTHPGMRPRPLIAPVFRAAEDDAEDAVVDVLFEGIR